MLHNHVFLQEPVEEAEKSEAAAQPAANELMQQEDAEAAKAAAKKAKKLKQKAKKQQAQQSPDPHASQADNNNSLEDSSNGDDASGDDGSGGDGFGGDDGGSGGGKSAMNHPSLPPQTPPKTAGQRRNRGADSPDGTVPQNVKQQGAPKANVPAAAVDTAAAVISSSEPEGSSGGNGMSGDKGLEGLQGASPGATGAEGNGGQATALDAAAAPEADSIFLQSLFSCPITKVRKQNLCHASRHTVWMQHSCIALLVLACLPLEKGRVNMQQAAMKEPVIAADGYTYERAAIEGWLHDCLVLDACRSRVCCMPRLTMPRLY